MDRKNMVYIEFGTVCGFRHPRVVLERTTVYMYYYRLLYIVKYGYHISKKPKRDELNYQIKKHVFNNT